MEHHNACDSIDSMLASRSPTPLATLGKLPLELRRLIYGPLFKAGSVALTRVSKTMNEDTKASVSEHGVYHVTIAPNDDNGFKCLIAGVAIESSTPVIPTHVQNLALDFLPDYELHGSFNDEMQEPRLCAIVNGIILQLEKTKHCRLTFGVLDQAMRVVLALEVLHKFESVNVDTPDLWMAQQMHAVDIWRSCQGLAQATE